MLGYLKLISVPPFQMGKTSYRGQGPRSRGQAITQGCGGARQTGGPQHQANPVHRLNTGCPKSDNDRRPSDNDRRPNNKDRRQYSDGRLPPCED